MRVNLRLYVAIIAAMLPAVALADDPKDPTMHSAAARARDREMTRRANLTERAIVRRRDAREARGWHVTRTDRSAYEAVDHEYSAASRDHDLDVESYARRRRQYERELAGWRQAVAACRAGDYAACEN